MEDIGQEYTELTDSTILNGAPKDTPMLQILQDRYINNNKDDIV